MPAVSCTATVNNITVFALVVVKLITVVLTTHSELIDSNSIAVRVGSGPSGSIIAPTNKGLLRALTDRNVFLSSTYNNNNAYTRYHYHIVRKNNSVLPARRNCFARNRVHGRVHLTYRMTIGRSVGVRVSPRFFSMRG